MEKVNRDSKQLLLAEGRKIENEPKIRPLAAKTGLPTGGLVRPAWLIVQITLSLPHVLGADP